MPLPLQDLHVGTNIEVLQKVVIPSKFSPQADSEHFDYRFTFCDHIEYCQGIVDMPLVMHIVESPGFIVITEGAFFPFPGILVNETEPPDWRATCLLNFGEFDFAAILSFGMFPLHVTKIVV